MNPDAEVPARRILPEGRFAGPMPWVIAIMILLSVLSAATGLAIAEAARSMQGALADRVTIQIVEANPDLRTRQRIALIAELKRTPNVRDVNVVSDEAVRDLLAPWLGADVIDADLRCTGAKAEEIEVELGFGITGNPREIDRHRALV